MLEHPECRILRHVFSLFLFFMTFYIFSILKKLIQHTGNPCNTFEYFSAVILMAPHLNRSTISKYTSFFNQDMLFAMLTVFF